MRSRRPLRFLLGAVALLTLSVLTAACTGQDSRTQSAGPGAGTDAVGQTDASATRVTGRLIDDETGAPVARGAIFVHAFHDATDQQVTLRPADELAFELTIPGDEIRLRIPDVSHEYELFEQTFTANNGLIDVEIRLRPTHWVNLHGKVLWRDGARLRTLREGDGNVRSARVTMAPGSLGLSPRDDGTYSRRVPRQLLEILTVNTNRSPSARELDLRGFEGDTYEHDVVLE